MSSNNKNSYKRDLIKMRALNILVLAFFIGSLVSMVYFSKKNSMFFFFIFGLYFLVLGSVALIGAITSKKLKNNLFLFLFPLIGLGAMICSGISMWGKNFNITLSEKGVLTLFICLVILIGIGIISSVVLPFIIVKVKKWDVVDAKCVELEESNTKNSRNGPIFYTPIFSYYYRGFKYTSKLNIKSFIGLPKVGVDYNIYVNPCDPKDIHRSYVMQYMPTIMFGSMILLSGIGYLYLVINQ